MAIISHVRRRDGGAAKGGAKLLGVSALLAKVGDSTLHDREVH